MNSFFNVDCNDASADQNEAFSHDNTKPASSSCYVQLSHAAVVLRYPVIPPSPYGGEVCHEAFCWLRARQKYDQ